jgi:hypothetical protein
MPAARLLLWAAAASARDDYVAKWARLTAARCNTKHCEWMSGFPPVDVGCRIVIDEVGFDDGAPSFRVVFADGQTLALDARNASTGRFRERPALCEYLMYLDDESYAAEPPRPLPGE